ncbi:MAG: acetyltransferase [Lachnospiraceae bacterium]|nr:acetyltransferase [Lachnospiraceae bacterium]
MANKEKKLVIVGAGEFAEIAYEYFTYDSAYEVVAFAVESRYIKEKELFGLPIVPFEDISKEYPPEQYYVYVALYYGKLNRSRTRLYHICKDLGYSCASYISSRAFVWHNVIVGENTFIFEDNTIQYHVQIGNNVVLWSGNHVGHRTVIEDNCWLTSHDVVSGFCRIGKNSFLGVNATVGDEVVLGEDTVLGAGSVTVKSLPEKGGVYVGNPVRKLDRTAYEQFGVEDAEI